MFVLSSLDVDGCDKMVYCSIVFCWHLHSLKVPSLAPTMLTPTLDLASRGAVPI